MNLDILYEDQDIIVCLKPAGIPTQSSHIGTPDMVSILKNHIYKNETKKQAPYIAVIHRLDQPVEGLLVFAKTPAAAKNLNKQLTDQGFGKHYRALLIGTPKDSEGFLTDYLQKDGRTNTSTICSQSTQGAKKAVLHYKIIKNAPPYSLAEITLETGRHHQIRVQMANLGCPIAGDRKYGNNSQQSSVPNSEASAAIGSTLQLYACRLTFKHPRTQKALTFQIDRLNNI